MSIIRYGGGLRLDIDSGELTESGLREPILLTPTELEVIKAFMSRDKSTYSSQALNDIVWDGEKVDRTPRFFVRQLQKKLLDHDSAYTLKNYRGYGWRLERIDNKRMPELNKRIPMLNENTGRWNMRPEIYTEKLAEEEEERDGDS